MSSDNPNAYGNTMSSFANAPNPAMIVEGMDVLEAPIPTEAEIRAAEERERSWQDFMARNGAGVVRVDKPNRRLWMRQGWAVRGSTPKGAQVLTAFPVEVDAQGNKSEVYGNRAERRRAARKGRGK